MTAPDGRDLWFVDDGRIMGGGQRVALRLARFAAAPPHGRVVTFVCPDGSQLAREARAAGFTTLHLDLPDPVPSAARRLGAAARRLRGLLAGADPGRTILVGNSARAQAVAMLAVATMRRHPPLVNLMQERDSAGRLSVRITHRIAGRVVAVGSDAAGAYAHALGAGRVRAMNNFLLPQEVEALAALRRPRRAGAPVVGVLGRVIPEKGIAEFVAELPPDDAAWSRVVLGGLAQDREYAARVEDAIAAAGLTGRVVFAGEVPDLHAFLGELDVLAVPSTGNEGQPTVILEGLAAGLGLVVRRSVWSADFDGLPVVPYDGAADLATALADASHAAPADTGVLAERFGPAQALRALDAAAGGPRSIA